MKLFIFVILLGVTGYVIAGGVSQCGPLVQTFAPFLQLVESIVDFVLDKTNGKWIIAPQLLQAQNKLILILSLDAVRESPFVGNSYLRAFDYFLAVTNITFINGISQLSGLSADYVNGILNETISQPFESPLDCITAELLSFITFSKNNFGNIFNPLFAVVQSSPSKSFK